jgi:hypothetical protein
MKLVMISWEVLISHKRTLALSRICAIKLQACR